MPSTIYITCGDSNNEPDSYTSYYSEGVRPNEIYDGIISITTIAYGDDIDHFYLEVMGIDEEAVRKTWEKIAKTSHTLLREWWSTGELSLGNAAFRPSQNPHSGG